jgi:predicted nucleotide-binding protein
VEDKTLPKLCGTTEEAHEKIQERIDKGQQLRDRQIDSRDEYSRALSDHGNWSRHNKNLLLQLFDGSLFAEEYTKGCIFLPTRPFLPASTGERVTEEKVEFSRDLDRYRKNIDRDINHLMGIQDQLKLYDEPDLPTRTFGDKIFIVHGHDEAAKHKIARFISDLDLSAIILDEQPSRGQTIIDKFEEHANEAGFAIVLLTADDVGAPKNKKDEPKPRARQNVIMELGYFLCGLGRDRVRILYEEGVELPSDIHGIIYVQMDERGAWKLELAQEMASIGMTVDMNKLLPNR